MIATLPERRNAISKDNNKDKEKTEPHSAPVVASLEGVTKNYGEIRALRNVNFNVHAGQVVALLGPNGAGKTTAVKLLLGLIQPTRENPSLRRRSDQSRKTAFAPEPCCRLAASLKLSRSANTSIYSPAITPTRCRSKKFWPPRAWKN